MFPHLCRVCLKELKSISGRVPLFEPQDQDNVLYHLLISSTFQLSTLNDVELAPNLCRTCANFVLRCHKFRLKYIESERILRKMLDQSKAKSNGAARKKRATESSSHSQDGSPKKSSKNTAGKAKEAKLWKCDECPAELSSKKLKLKHESEQHSNYIPFIEPAIHIHDEDDDYVDPHENLLTPMNGHDDDIVEEPEIDVNYSCSMEKPIQISGYDPLEDNDSNDSLLMPMNDVSSKWKCRICFESFRTRDHLRDHNHIHMAQKAHMRELTRREKQKKGHNAISERLVVWGGDILTKWQCQTCGTPFQKRDLLRAHRRTSCSKRRATMVGGETEVADQPSAIEERIDDNSTDDV